MTDTNGNILHIQVHAANIHDTTAGVSMLKTAIEKYPSIRGVCADTGYRGTTENYVKNMLRKTIEISKKALIGWTVLPKRWVVERTFGWLNGFRRLAKDYEISINSAENFVRISHISTLIHRAA